MYRNVDINMRGYKGKSGSVGGGRWEVGVESQPGRAQPREARAGAGAGKGVKCVYPLYSICLSFSLSLLSCELSA